MALGAYILNGKDLFGVFGVTVQSGSGTFLSFPERKGSLQHNWSDQDGLDIDLSAPRFEARDFRLQCTLITNSRSDFWTKYNGLFTELSAMGTHQLYVEDLDKTYTLYYKNQTNLKKLTRLANNMLIGVSFDLVFGETDPMDNIEAVYLVDDQDRYLIA